MHVLALVLALAPLSSGSPAPVPSPVALQDEVSAERIDAAVKALEEAAKGSDPAVYAQTIRDSVEVVDKRVISLIAKALKSKDETVSATAIDTLGHMRNPDAASSLVSYYKGDKKALNGDEAKLAELLKAIGRQGNVVGVDTLVDSPFSAKSYAVIQARLMGLGMIRDSKALDAIFKLLEKVNLRDLDRYMPDIRLALVQLTGEDQGNDPNQWKDWWRSNKKGYEVSPEAKPLPLEMRVRWNEYWGITEKEPEVK